LKDNTFDAVISIAVIHHFSNELKRMQAIREMHRILKLGGKLLIYVWAFEQDGKKYETQDVFVPWHLQKIHDKSKKEKEEQKSEETAETVPKSEESKEISEDKKIKKAENEKEKEKVFKRYYHMFKENELNILINKVEGLEIVKTYYDTANWCVISQKSQT
jgi:ubiquinone/menaquinone biosynthesis C-methylase UbiE